MLTLEDLAALYQKYAPASRAEVKNFSLAGRTFQFERSPAIMGVINLSPGSWYRESVCLSAEQAINRGKVLAAQGAHIVDIGAESTLAHTDRVDDAQQTRLLLPVVRALQEEGILVSVETYEAAVAQAALATGAKVLNWTGTAESEKVFPLVAEHQAAVILCYVQGQNVREVGNLEFAGDPIDVMHDYFGRLIDRAVGFGVERIFIDPGLGFYYRNLQDSAARIRHQMRTFLQSFRLRTLGWPVCHALPHAFEIFGDEVRTAEPFFATLAALGKTDMFRTHEVTRVKAVLDTLGLCSMVH